MPKDQLLVMALHHFVLNGEHSASIAHIPFENNHTERPPNTRRYSNNKTSSGTQTVPLKLRESQSPKSFKHFASE